MWKNCIHEVNIQTCSSDGGGCAAGACVGQDEVRVATGDGILDCAEGQVHRDAGVSLSGSTELEVVVRALVEWTDGGAELVELPSHELWTAVMNGRDVAIAYPELNGDGTWVLHDVRVCGEPDVGTAAVDGVLDCANETYFSVQGSFDPTATGLPTAEDAIHGVLEPYVERFGGEVAFVDADTGSLVVDEREQVVANATEAPARGWVVGDLSGCEGYER